MGNHLLAIYLNDHLAGATGGHELAKRSTGNNRGTDYETELSSIAAEIGEDKEALERLMRDLGIPRSPWKTGAAWVAEKVGRGKLNGTFLGYSALSRLEELEALKSGVLAKASMWSALAEAATAIRGVSKQEMQRLLRRAEGQAQRLEALRLRAATEALSRS
jgi:hypothetical protein